MVHADNADEGTWAVYRQDDLGNRFLVRTGLGREEAGSLAAELQARGHKQLYWIEQVNPSLASPVSRSPSA